MKYNKTRICYFIVDIILIILFIKIYRPYIYINNINDYHIADSIPNLFATLIMCNVICMKEKNVENENLLYVVSIVIGLISYEFIQYYFNIGVCDLYDIIFTLYGGIIAFFINKYLK